MEESRIQDEVIMSSHNDLYYVELEQNYLAYGWSFDRLVDGAGRAAKLTILYTFVQCLMTEQLWTKLSIAT